MKVAVFMAGAGAAATIAFFSAILENCKMKLAVFIAGAGAAAFIAFNIAILEKSKLE